MTGLHRTALTTPQKIECAANVLARQGEHGSVTALGEEFGLSRPTIYAAGNAAHEVLTRHFEDTANGTVRVEVPGSPYFRDSSFWASEPKQAAEITGLLSA